MNPFLENQMLQTRRQFFGNQGLRLGSLALGLIMADSKKSRAQQVHMPIAGLPHHKPTAKSIIYFHMNGAPSQIDLWDYKPILKDFFNKDLPPPCRVASDFPP